MMPRFISNQIKGFSLIEVLLSIALLSVVIALIYNAFSQVSDSTKKVTESLESGQELRLLMKIVLDDLRSVQYMENLVVHNNPGSDGPYFHSGIVSERSPGPDNSQLNSIHFHTAIPTRFFPEAIALNKDPELHEVGYTLEFNSFEEKWIFKRREDFYVDDDMLAGGKEQTLSESVVQFELEFLEQNILEADSSELQEVWVNEWDSLENNCSTLSKQASTPCLPLAIRLTMSLQKKGEGKVTDTLEVNLPVSLQQ
ncbi:MAG: prepilin-type N-terminal cleavage/methylation domain-containing protein [SAR324 cluster bacterium]|nr:prepilin-type N-terminal cleavage/methylation domain-containing protein [SAR324 cluster bacterium]